MKYAANLICSGEVVAMPTETVYGLAANALDDSAVSKIFLAKGRPQDNPLIVHIADVASLCDYAKDINPIAYTLLEEFKGLPLSLVLHKKNIISNVVSGGLDTVAIRIPNNEVAIELIRQSGTPVAAPSANISGRPSPTTAVAVYSDMAGKIPLILDGGSCNVGVESTVVSLTSDIPILLRPGAVTFEMLAKVIPNIKLSESIFKAVKKGDKVSSPGMKYKHYAPSTRLIMLSGNINSIENYLKDKLNNRVGVMCYTENKIECEHKFIYGSICDASSCNRLVFDTLRNLDKSNLDLVYVISAGNNGDFLAVYNRLIKACSYNEIIIK